MKFIKFHKKVKNKFSFFKAVFGFPAFAIASFAAYPQVVQFFSPNYEITGKA